MKHKSLKKKKTVELDIFMCDSGTFCDEPEKLAVTAPLGGLIADEPVIKLEKLVKETQSEHRKLKKSLQMQMKRQLHVVWRKN